MGLGVGDQNFVLNILHLGDTYMTSKEDAKYVFGYVSWELWSEVGARDRSEGISNMEIFDVMGVLGTHQGESEDGENGQELGDVVINTGD